MVGMTPADSDDDIAPAPAYKLASRRARGGEPTVVEIGDCRIGGEHFALVAGPCAVETRELTLAIARAVRDGGATMLRGGAYKPRTSPYAFQGLGHAGLAILAEAREQMAMAAAAVGADGIVVEVHPEPDTAACDVPQSLYLDDFARFAARVERAAELAGKNVGAAVS